MKARFGNGLTVLGLACSLVLCTAIGRSAIEMTTGIRYVIPNGSLSECSAKAKTALNAYLTNAAESSPGSGEWIASGSSGINGATSATAVVRCYQVGSGYVVTFTCAVQVPGSLYGADPLCIDVAHNFSGKPVTPLPTPTPIPTGCSTTNLVGSWASNDSSGPTFKIELDGNLTDAEGTSGNWILNGMTATLTYYGNHTLTLSADGKHLTGGGYSLTRKC